MHETLSQSFDEHVDFDEVADRVRAMVADVSASTAPAVETTRRTGSFGVLASEVATPLAMALTELMQNSVEHGLGSEPGVVEIHADRSLGRLRMSVTDDGRGLPPGFDSEMPRATWACRSCGPW